MAVTVLPSTSSALICPKKILCAPIFVLLWWLATELAIFSGGIAPCTNTFFGFFLSINNCFYTAFHVFQIVKAKFVFKDFYGVFASFSRLAEYKNLLIIGYFLVS